MNAIILAAGQGKRLQSLDHRGPKCLLQVAGKSLLRLQVEHLQKAGIKEIVVVTGFEHTQLSAQKSLGLNFVHNPFWESTDDLASLFMARHHIKGPFLYLHSDILFPSSFLKDLLKNREPAALLVDEEVKDEEIAKVRIKDGLITGVGKHIPLNEAHGEFVGMVRFSSEGSASFLKAIEECMERGQTKEPCPTALNRFIEAGMALSPCFVQKRPWIEIDFPADFFRAEKEVYPQILLEEEKEP